MHHLVEKKVTAQVILGQDLQHEQDFGKLRSRVIANLGPIEKIGMDAVRNLANGFSRIAGEQRNT